MSVFSAFVSQQWPLFMVLGLLIAVLWRHESRSGGPVVSPHLLTLLINNQGARIIDLRSSGEFEDGHIAGAENIPWSDFHGRLPELQGACDTPLVLVCAMGQQAPSAVRRLRAAGLTTLHRLGGGISEWRNQRYPLVAAKR